MVSKTFPLDENFSIIIEKTEDGKDFYIKDNILNTKRHLAILTENQKWKFLTPIIESEFWKLVKKYPSRFRNNIYKPIEEKYEVTIDKKINCFKRKFNIKLIRTAHKIKHTI